MKESERLIFDARKNWLSLWERLGASGDSEVVFNDLLRRYREPHRFYHTIVHIEDCLDKLNLVRRLVVEPEAVELAIWFHGAVYDPGASDNEERSARFATDVIKQMGRSDSFAARVANLIMATRHTRLFTDFDAQILADIDLSILGAPKEKFDEYEAQIRQEYANIPESVFKEERGKILKGFLQRRTIYSTQYFFDKYEKQARQNLTRSIEALSNY